VIALAIALAAATVQGEAQEASPRLTVGEWRSRDDRERRILLIGAVEGLMLASLGPGGETIGIDTTCLPQVLATDVEGKLREIPDQAAFVLSVVETSGC
jgi:hypothetical protein